MTANKSNKKPLMQMLLDAGYPREEMFHHYSDLYIFITPLTMRITNAWCKANGFNKDWFCPSFRDQITGKGMYDCAFQYIPELIQGNKIGLLHNKEALSNEL